MEQNKLTMKSMDARATMTIYWYANSASGKYFRYLQDGGKTEVNSCGSPKKNLLAIFLMTPCLFVEFEWLSTSSCRWQQKHSELADIPQPSQQDVIFVLLFVFLVRGITLNIWPLQTFKWSQFVLSPRWKVDPTSIGLLKVNHLSWYTFTQL